MLESIFFSLASLAASPPDDQGPAESTSPLANQESQEWKKDRRTSTFYITVLLRFEQARACKNQNPHRSSWLLAEGPPSVLNSALGSRPSATKTAVDLGAFLALLIKGSR